MLDALQHNLHTDSLGIDKRLNSNFKVIIDGFFFLLRRTGEELLMSRLSGTLMIMRWRAFVEKNGHKVSGNICYH